MLCGVCVVQSSARVKVGRDRTQHVEDCNRKSVADQGGCRGPSPTRRLEGVIGATPNPPNFDMAPTCGAAEQSPVGRSRATCLEQEHIARDDLRQRWSEFSDLEKRRCTNLTNSGGPPSYVELISCLEAMKGTSTTERANRVSPETKGAADLLEPAVK